MEGLSDIVILLLIVATSLIGSATNRRKKRQLPSPQNDSPWEDYPKTASYTENTPKKESPVTETLPLIPAQKLKKTIIPVPKPTPLTPKEEIILPADTHDSENDIQQIIDHFDLRTAVIYKEILEPKFKEY